MENDVIMATDDEEAKDSALDALRGLVDGTHLQSTL